MLDLFPFALAGALQGEHLWLVDLVLSWRRLRELCGRVTATDEVGLTEMAQLVAEVRPQLLRLYRVIKRDPQATLDRHPSYHTLLHLCSAVRNLGSLPEQSTDQFEHVHRWLKALFVECTNHSHDEEVLVPQVMRAAQVRQCKPTSTLALRVGATKIVYPELSIVASSVQRLETVVATNMSAFRATESQVLSFCAFLPNWCDWYTQDCPLVTADMSMVVRLLKRSLRPIDHDLHAQRCDLWRVDAGTGCKGPFGWAVKYLERDHDVLLETTDGHFCVLLLPFTIHANVLVSSPLFGVQLFCKRLQPALPRGAICPRFRLPFLKDSCHAADLESYCLLNPARVKATWSLVPVAPASDKVALFYAHQ